MDDRKVVDTDQTPAANIASHIAAMDDDTLNRFVHAGTTDELERGMAIAEQRRRNADAERRAILDHHAEQEAAAHNARSARLEARQQARATFDDAQERPTPSAALGQRRGSQGPSKNQAFAETFAAILQGEGMNAKARQTKRIQGREVVDGWTVNVRDDAQEVGIVAAWWGRNHFTCFLEVAGHAERTEEAAAIMLAAMRHVWGQ